MKSEQKNQSTADKSFTVGRFRSEDAEGLVALFRAVYGEKYPIRLFYDPAAIILANEQGQYYSIVARSASGRLVGVNHLFRSAPYPNLYEAGVGLVLKDYRNLGINKQILSYLYDSFVPDIPHIQAVFGEAVCNHPYMQKTIIPYKHIEMAIEVALMPASAYAKEKSASGRVATLTAFRSYQSSPHRIFMPEVYEEELRWVYDRLDDARDLCLSHDKIPAGSATQANLQLMDFARVARIAIPGSGSDLEICMTNLEATAREKKAVVFQAWVNLTEPWAGETVATLRRMGYFFGGALPRWFDGDGLLMQKLDCPPDFESIVLATEAGRRILSFIETDRKKVI